MYKIIRLFLLFSEKGPSIRYCWNKVGRQEPNRDKMLRGE